MKERPILFSAPMVQALLDGRKTQTRRIVKPKDVTAAGIRAVMGGTGPAFGPCPYGQPGDRLWVREGYYQFGHWEPVLGVRTKTGRQKWRFVPESTECLFEPPASFRKGRHHKDPSTPAWHKRLGRFMPRWASRILLEITAIRVERLQDISEADAKAEGCESDKPKIWWQGYMWDEHTADYIHQQTIGDAPPDWMIEPKRMSPKPWLLRTSTTRYRNLWESINGPGSWDANPWVWAITFRRIEL